MAVRSEIRTVGLCLKPESAAAGEAARSLDKWLAERGIEVRLDPVAAGWLDRGGSPGAELAREVDLLVVLGGDGTLLAAARDVGARPVPILGVNLGTLGFLAEVAPEEQFEALERVLAGELQVIERMRLSVRAERGGEVLGRYLAINDAVITRSELSRMIRLETLTDEVPVSTYRGDGLIVATPTGSTAYSLSAGGPILQPDFDAFVLTPICPHTLTQRPIVLPATSVIEIRPFPGDGSAQLTVDGQAGLVLQDGDRVMVERSDHPAHFVVTPFRSRFEILRTKLGWGSK